MKRVLLTLAGLATLGLLVAFSGLVPIKASSGHWAVTRWFLNFAMSRSVETHTIGTDVPDLSDPSLVLQGARHYESGCKPCHGAPGDPRSRVTLGMTPHPPYLPRAVPQWDPDDLFYIVKHGVKFTGMPAWPAPRRDDEVWAMVAFLLTLPELDAAEYRRLALGPDADPAATPGLAQLADAPEPVRSVCARCHGLDGLGRGREAFPRLAGQSGPYLAAALRAYAAGERLSGFMQPVARQLSEEAVRQAVRHYAGRPAPDVDPARPGARGEGESIAREGVPATRVPACVDCHGPGDAPRNPFYPRLAGQHAEYLLTQLRLFREDRRGGSPYAHIMRLVAGRMTDREMAAVAEWYASLAAPEAPVPGR